MAVAEAVSRLLGGEVRLVRGQVIAVEPDGGVRVRFGPTAEDQRVCDVLRTDVACPSLGPGEPVLVALPEGTRERAVILGVVGVARPAGTAVERTADPSPETAEHRLHHRRIVVEADEELTLQCGDASIQIRRDGKILIRGEHILSRAKGTQRIKGGSVAIN